MTIPFLDLRAGYDELREQLEAAALRALRSGWYILGAELQRFESEWAAYCQARHAVGVGDGLSAITLALRACGIGPGDEVIVPAHTFVATWLAVSGCGARPVPVDVDPATANLSAAGFEAAITPRTRAVIPVDLYGSPAPISQIVALARRHDIRVIEDAAQAHGARIGTRRVGAHADAVCWSFYPGKNLGAFGDGGAVTTDSEAIATQVRLLRNYGSKEKYEHEAAGINSRLDEVQAAILACKLPRLEAWNDRRAKLAQRYAERLSRHGFWLQRTEPDSHAVHHLLVTLSRDRDALRKALAGAGIETLVHYPTPPHLQPAYRSLGLPASAFPVARHLAAHALSLPIGPHMPLEAVDRVCDAIDEAVQRGVAGPSEPPPA